MNFKEVKKYLIIFTGISIIVFYCFFTLISFIFYPLPYSPINNALSDLGCYNFNPKGAIFYNLGCILTGILLFPFFIGFYIWYRDKVWHKLLGYSFQILGGIFSINLIMVGIFSEDFPIQHSIFSIALFLSFLVVLILGSIFLGFHPESIKIIIVYGIGVIIFNFIFTFIIFLTLFGVISLESLSSFTFLEWFSIFTALGWVGLLVYNTYKIF